jgi:hypothetical protein
MLGYDQLGDPGFSENEELLRRYQEKFQYILVDEFQDTSWALKTNGQTVDQFLG